MADHYDWPTQPKIVIQKKCDAVEDIEKALSKYKCGDDDMLDAAHDKIVDSTIEAYRKKRNYDLEDIDHEQNRRYNDEVDMQRMQKL